MPRKKEVYTQKAVTTGISADVKMTIKINDNYYSVTTHEDRTLPTNTDVNLQEEWDFLYESIYNVCAEQILQIKEQLTDKKKRKNF